MRQQFTDAAIGLRRQAGQFAAQKMEEIAHEVTN